MKPWYAFLQCNAGQMPIAAKMVDLVIGSPPYTDRRKYPGAPPYIQTQFTVLEWVDWMLRITHEGLRVSRGPVIWIANGKIEDGRYHAAVEGLIWEAYKSGIHCEHPLIWSKNALPSRTKGDWWNNGWEYITAFIPPEWDHKFNWQEIATQQKYMSGGGTRFKGVDGQRRVQEVAERREKAAPYDIIRATVGGGHMGHPAGSETDAGYPESLIEPIILALTDPGDLIYDPFSGSGTTVAVAAKHGRRAIGGDCRMSQCQLGRRRMTEPVLTKREQVAQSAFVGNLFEK